ncbi:kinase [Mesobaculum littorinae]|uniref:Kinase n=1 Tax=Mesobaculum littorinae TaxID=2486419 RepID=A0A438ALL0_9RHOB|nr:PfkB family carbohydrate kinase [Mesobaculum littorinae]RVV99638.1 kinase [Mesobaculum littorinae]
MTTPDILCIGSVLWDVIGRANAHMRVGSDVPGRITRIPGGVAMNIAMTLRRFGLTPALLTAVGRDPVGDELIEECRLRGMITDHVYRSEDLPTDRYMAIEGANGLIAAVADAHSLEAAGGKILRALAEGPLGTSETPWQGPAAVDGNLTLALLSEIADSPAFRATDLRLAPASPGKAERLLPLLAHPRATLYVNLEEAGLLLHRPHDTSRSAARALIDQGAQRVLVTNGGQMAALADATGVIEAAPREVMVTRVTGAGDTFMAAHIAAETRGETGEAALATALGAAADYVSGDVAT